MAIFVPNLTPAERESYVVAAATPEAQAVGNAALAEYPNPRTDYAHRALIDLGKLEADLALLQGKIPPEVWARGDEKFDRYAALILSLTAPAPNGQGFVLTPAGVHMASALKGDIGSLANQAAKMVKDQGLSPAPEPKVPAGSPPPAPPVQVVKKSGGSLLKVAGVGLLLVGAGIGLGFIPNPYGK